MLKCDETQHCPSYEIRSCFNFLSEVEASLSADSDKKGR